ncbi:hypothetical protein [Phytomonospora endophytica]|uniref:Uncharacterized protein n=1 Tax=Phytomonospora endophytica TaxID=714109 RepID=A0A841FNT8_9ACTN|nr:hypothetical protein [Phytomonospora endophytica]MBB6034887.1 hypothetical protein [Phytomonospora endophytica]GIG70591.1 hypothetical protein Pen01_68860 [Phytomonospora endophytica]
MTAASGITVDPEAITGLADELGTTVHPALRHALDATARLSTTDLPPTLAAACTRAARTAGIRAAARVAGLGLIRRALTDTAERWSDHTGVWRDAS